MKRYLTILIFFSLVLSGSLCRRAYANSSSGKKIVTIVYDDSGSMGSENRYSNANYAIQAFISLLDQEDELYLIYMSDVQRAIQADPSNPNPAGLAVAVNLSDPQAAADQVRSQPWNLGGTPYSSIQVAYNELFNHPDTDPSTSYYLVVLSDGGFMDDVTNQITIDTAEVQARFESYYQTPMPNQTRLNTYYLAIGNEAVPLTDRPDLNFHALVTVDGQSLIHTIGQMADMISGRYRLDASEVIMLDGRTVSVTSALPLRNISFLSLGREASVSSVTGPDGTAYEITRNVTLAPDAYNADPSLFGNAILADNHGENIPAGTYTVQFTSDVDPACLTVMFEPALAYQLHFYCQEEEISAEALPSLMEGEEITVRGTVVEAGTDTAIDPALLSAETAYRLSYQAGDTVVSEAEGQEMPLILEGGENRITGTMQMPGFLPITDDVRFDMDSVIYGVEADTEKVSARQNEMDTCSPVRFYITGNGERLQAKDALRYELSEPVIGGGDLEYTWTREEDGSYLFQPKGKTDSLGELTVTTALAGLPEVLIQLGTMNLTASAVVESLPKIEYAIEAEPGQTEVRQNELDSCLPVRFYLTADQERLSAEEAAQYVLDEPVITGGMFEYQWYFDETDGCYVFQPTGETEDIGEMVISAACQELEASAEVSLKILLRVQYGIEAVQEEDSVLQTGLGAMKPIRFYITADGRRMTKEEVEELPLTCKAVFEESGFFIWDTGNRTAGFRKKLSVGDDGGFVFQPKGRSWFYGGVRVTLTLPDEAEGEAYFTINKNMWLYWVPMGAFGVLLFLIWCIIGWIRQPKFHNQIMEIVAYTKFGVGIQESPRIKVMKHRIGLIPWKACRMRVGDMVFVAGDNRKILLDKDCVRSRVVYAGKVRFMGRNAGNMGRLLRMMEPTKRDIRLVRGMELYVADDKTAEVITGYRLTSN